MINIIKSNTYINIIKSNKYQLKAKAKEDSCCWDQVKDDDLETMREALHCCITGLGAIERPNKKLRMFIEDAELWEERLDGVLAKDPRYCFTKEHLMIWYFRDLYRKYDVGSFFSAVTSELDDEVPECDALRMQFRLERPKSFRVTRRDSSYGNLTRVASIKKPADTTEKVVLKTTSLIASDTKRFLSYLRLQRKPKRSRYFGISSKSV